MRARALAPTTLLCLSVAAIAPRASAQGTQPSADLRGFRASADPGAGLYLEPAASPGTGEWNAAVWMSYAYRPVALEDPASEALVFDVVGHQLSADLAAHVGIAKRVALGVDMPFVVYQTGDERTAGSAAAEVMGPGKLPSNALGDLGLVGKLTLVRPTRDEFGGFALALHERFTLPTGDEASFVGEGGVTSETRLLMEYRLVALGVYVAAGAKLRAETARFACATLPEDDPAGGGDPCPTRFGHELPFGLGFTLRPQALGIDEEGRLTFYLETHGYLPISPIAPFESERVAAAQLGGGVRYAVRDVAVLGGLETALVGGAGNAPLRVLASVSWAPRVHDVDGDGLDDDVDQCRELGEDRDGFQDDDGCPEGDNDDDGVPDSDDRCPAQKEDEDEHQDDDGCLDPDDDGDGVLDVADACQSEAGPRSDDPQRNGCPVRDADADGIQGEKDACPDAAEDKDGFQDEDGCPDPDNDGDGVADPDDACPAESGPTHADPKRSGCPDPDPDMDTMLPPDDKCPKEAEVWNGVDDADGCPDGDAQKKAAPLVVVREQKGAKLVEMSGPIRFTEAGDVDPASAPLLAALATELLRNPTWSVRVGVRPSPKTGEEGAKKRAGAVAAAIQRLARRQGAAEVAAWDQVKGAPRAVVHGVGVELRVGAAAPAGEGAPKPVAAPPPGPKTP